MASITLPIQPGGSGGIASINGDTTSAQSIVGGTGISVATAAGTTTITNTGSTASLTDSHIFVGNVSNVATDVAMSGDITIANTGATTIANLAVTNAKIANTTIDLTAKVTGVLPIANGGTNSSTALSNNRFIVSSGSKLVEAAAVTASRALVSDANGLPVAATTTATEIGFVNGVTSSIQTQLNAKASTTLTNTHILVGNGSNIATDVAMSGNVTISNTGATTIGAGVVTNSMLAGSIAASKLVGSDIATVGTVTTGTWNATTIAVNHGGTSNTSFTAFSVLCAGTTSTGAFQNVSGLGTSGQVLTSNGAGALPTWQPGGGGASPLTTKGDLFTFDTADARLPVGSDGQILSADSSQATGLKWITSGAGGPVAIFYPDEVLLSTPVVYYRLGDSTGPTAADSSGNGNDGTYSGAITLGVRGAVFLDENTAATFNGTNTLITGPGSPVNYEYNTPFSVEFWYQGASYPGSVISHVDGITGVGWQCYFSGGLIVLLMTGTGGVNSIQMTAPLPFDAFYHQVVITYSGSGIASGVNFYCDGLLLPPTVVSDNLTSHSIHNTGDLTIGSGSAGLLNGTLDEIAIYSSELSAATIALHYQFAPQLIAEGSNQQVQYNNHGRIFADQYFYYDNTTNSLYLPGTSALNLQFTNGGAGTGPGIGTLGVSKLILSGGNSGWDVDLRVTNGGSGGTPAASLVCYGFSGDIQLGLAGNSVSNNGYCYIPSAAGTPAGVPTGRSGFNPIQIDTATSQLWFYNAGWVSTKTPPAGTSGDVQINNGSGGFGAVTGTNTSGTTFLQSATIVDGIITAASFGAGATASNSQGVKGFDVTSGNVTNVYTTAVAPDGTYVAPTSITISGGLITAIS